jgi:four helix bundle protein
MFYFKRKKRWLLLHVLKTSKAGRKREKWFLGIARRSVVEVQSLLYTAFDIEYITEIQLKEYYEQARKTKALIGGFKHSLKKQTRFLKLDT